MPQPQLPISQQDLKEAQSYLTGNKVGTLSFSEGTYQVEVKDSTKKLYWPFLQLDDNGKFLDGFCSCPSAEKKTICVHLAAAYLKIFNDHSLPIHVRFRTSLWNELGKMIARRHGYNANALKKKENGFEALSATGKRLFCINPANPKSRNFIKDLIFNRSEETEETSLKFSNLPAEEIALWRKGNPSQHLLYELSFWSDLAKWWMQLQEEEEPYTMIFEKDSGLPKWLQVRFATFSFSFYIAEVNWPQIIPCLTEVKSPLKIHEFQTQKIKEIRYDSSKSTFLVESAPIASKKTETPISSAIPIGDFLFVPNEGFFPGLIDPLFDNKEIPSDKIASVFQKHFPILQKYLVGTPLQTQAFKAQYQIFFDKSEQLHVCCYVLEIGDLQKSTSAYFGPWVYLADKGFYLLENLLFNGAEKIIPRSKVSEFINQHRAWLNGFEGFHTHISTIESHLTYRVDANGVLRFASGLGLSSEGSDVVDFGDWVYLKEKGFFAKKLARIEAAIESGTQMQPQGITRFIRSYRNELENVQEFFSSKCPLEKSGLEIFLNESGKIVVRPKLHFLPFYQTKNVKIYGDFSYVEKEGFCEIPPDKRLPEGYFEEKVISLSDEPFFIAHELDVLRPFILSIQPQLQAPEKISIRVNQMEPYSKTKSTEWLIDLSYTSEMGAIDAYEIWQAIHGNKRHLFTQAGLIYLKHIRFNWLKNIPKKRWLKGGKKLRLTTLEWLRLTAFDEVTLSKEESKESLATRQILNELQTAQTDTPIDLTGFKSDLRSYQETGVKWLWFLYSHGLSGLLCDEMGLGKTHQAMGLIAAAKNKTAKGKYLIVCPTSVIYHWEALLQKFLPELHTCIFYGACRSLESFETHHEILLTSYGTLRSDKKLLSKIEFDIAIFDEIQIAKNTHSQIHKALKTIQAAMRLGLSGTPIENRLLELKALFDLVIPGYMPQEAHFKELFVNPIERNQDAEKKALLSRFIHSFILRRKKSEVLLELPSKIEEISYCDLSEEQTTLYQNVFSLHKEALLKDLKDNDKSVPYLHIFSLLASLKQICNHPSLISKDIEDFHKHKSGKWDLFVELLQEIRDSGQKVVVFSQYLDMLNIIEAYLKENNIGFTGIRGSTRNRKLALETFRDDPKCEVFVASLQAAGVGVDLVSASVVIHYDRWWNPARENQATDRVHRIGQNRGVQVFKLVTKNSIEEHIHQMIEKKLALTEGILRFDDHDQIKGFNREELLDLLQLIDTDLEKQN